jgi:hypothetical protein
MAQQADRHKAQMERIEAINAQLQSEVARLRPFEALAKEQEGTIADLRARLAAKSSAQQPQKQPERRA